MRKESIKLVSIMLVLLFSLFVIAPSSIAFAETNKLDSILIKISEEQVVKVSVLEYMKALSLKDKSDLYKYLKGDSKSPTIYGINSGDKYIATSNFMQALSKSGKDISKAIEAADSVSEDELSLIKEFKEFDEEGNPVLEEIIPQEPKVYTLIEIQSDALDTSMSAFGIYSVSIKFSNLQKIFPELTKETIFKLILNDEVEIELSYDVETDSFANWDIQGHDEESLLNAIVEMINVPDPIEPFRVKDIY